MWFARLPLRGCVRFQALVFIVMQAVHARASRFHLRCTDPTATARALTMCLECMQGFTAVPHSDLGLHALQFEDLLVGRCVPSFSVLGTTTCLVMRTRGCSVLYKLASTDICVSMKFAHVLLCFVLKFVSLWGGGACRPDADLALHS
jgi:hypothetical protein